MRVPNGLLYIITAHLDNGVVASVDSTFVSLTDEEEPNPVGDLAISFQATRTTRDIILKTSDEIYQHIVNNEHLNKKKIKANTKKKAMKLIITKIEDTPKKIYNNRVVNVSFETETQAVLFYRHATIFMEYDLDRTITCFYYDSERGELKNQIRLIEKVL